MLPTASSAFHQTGRLMGSGETLTAWDRVTSWDQLSVVRAAPLRGLGVPLRAVAQSRKPSTHVLRSRWFGVMDGTETLGRGEPLGVGPRARPPRLCAPQRPFRRTAGGGAVSLLRKR